MQRTLARRAGAAIVFAIVAAAPAGAQIDYRNLDDDRPTRVEDAYPTERYAFEFIVPYSYARDRTGAVIQASVLELVYGVFRNTQVGLKAPLVGVRSSGATTTWGLSGLRAFALYDFNTEGRLLPAVALRIDAAFPVGSLGGDETQVALKGIVTRSWGPTRLHLNGAVRLGRDAPGAVIEGIERWWYGAALDRTLFRPSVLLVGEVYAAREIGVAPVEVNASLGVRWQWRPTAVIDVGVARRLREGLGPDYAVTIGMSNAFAIARLMPRGR
ncbi:MAG TPA: hypothetical protein VK736_08510 [Candidatus Binatia bacterium]|nr:hypothetical protein [Candidatus Binatia bacterium]